MLPKQVRLEDEKVLEKVRGMGCCVCGKHPVDASHIKSRGSGGPDAEWNVVAHCRAHHSEWHTRGWKDFIRKYPQMSIKLTVLGWKWNGLDLWHPKNASVIIQPIQSPVTDSTVPIVAGKKKKPTSLR